MRNDSPRMAWYFRMAWRDSRRNRGRLALFISSIVLGIAALVSTLSFGHNLRMAIDDQAKALVGADLVLGSSRPVSPTALALADSAPNRHSEEQSFASMILFEKSGHSRMAQVRALEGDYPFYGSLVTTPAAAGIAFRRGQEALVDKTLMLQYGVHVGDSLRIGNLDFAIAGSVDQAPGRNEISTTVAPPVYIPLRYLKGTGLVRMGSRMEHRYYFQYPRSDMRKLMAAIGPRLEKADLDYETVEIRKRRMNRVFWDLTQFLTLISFIALLLGSVGVGSSVNIYIKEKIADVAVLRCLGLRARQAFFVYLVQVAGMALLGSLAGAVLGVAIQQVLPGVMRDILPLQTSFHVSWPAVAEGVIVGMVISLSFALVPLLSIRKISPMYTLRSSVEGVGGRWDILQWLVYVLTIVFITGFAYLRMRNWGKSIGFTVSLLVSFLFLVAMARLLMASVRRFFPTRWSYLWRQGFANLYRPNNQTLILVVTIGLGTTFIGTLYFVERMLIDRISAVTSGAQGNMILFDVQSYQLPGVDSLLAAAKLPVIQSVPVVTMKFKSIRGVTAETAVADTASRGERRRRTGSIEQGGRPPLWLFERELRVSYRDSLVASEKIASGRLGAPVKGSGQTVFISVDQDFARNRQIRIGDTIVFDVQGMPVTTVVGSLRDVEGRRTQPNFPILFPSGVLEQAPQFHVVITRVESPEMSARFQQGLVRRFPTVLVIDLRLVMSVLDEVLGKIGFVIRFMAGFSILTGVVVLIASVLISKFQRIQESVLLRTLGASRRQVRTIQLLEYFFLGSLAAATGILLALGLTYALAKLALESGFSIHWEGVAGLFLSVCAITIFVGWYNSRGILNRPPLEVLRNEG